MTRLQALRVCAECGRYFQPVRSQMTCSPECAGQRRRRQQRESKRRAWAADPEGERAKQRARRAANLAEYRAGERRRKRKRRAPHPPKTCPRCGVEFVPRRRDQRLCSPGCRPPRQCQHCGADYAGRANQRFCSARCRARHAAERRRRVRRVGAIPPDLALAGLALAASGDRRRKYVCTCRVCGTEFRSHREHARYCSRACANREHARRKRRGPTRLPPIRCAVCGRRFPPRKRNQKCCAADECRRRYKVILEQRRARRPEVAARRKRLDRLRKAVTASCIVCGRAMDDLPDLRIHRYTCSPECRREAARQRQRRSYERRIEKYRAAGLDTHGRKRDGIEPSDQ